MKEGFLCIDLTIELLEHGSQRIGWRRKWRTDLMLSEWNVSVPQMWNNYIYSKQQWTFNSNKGLNWPVLFNCSDIIWRTRCLFSKASIRRGNVWSSAGSISSQEGRAGRLSMTWPNTIGSSVPIKQQVDRAEDNIDEYVFDVTVGSCINIKFCLFIIYQH